MVTDRNLRSTMENEQLFSLCMVDKKNLPHLRKISAGAPETQKNFKFKKGKVFVGTFPFLNLKFYRYMFWVQLQ